MKTITLVPTILFLATLFLSFSSANAVTVSDYDFISAEIKKAQPLTFEEVREIFKDQTTMAYSCYVDEMLQSENEPESFQVFGPYLSFTPTGTIKSTVANFDFGYNITIHKTEAELKDDLFVMESSLECISGEKPGTCASFTISSEKPFTIEKPSDDFSDKAVRTEAWKIYFVEGQLYAERSVDFEATELNWLGARKGSINYSKRQVCHLAPQ